MSGVFYLLNVRGLGFSKQMEIFKKILFLTLATTVYFAYLKRMNQQNVFDMGNILLGVLSTIPF